MENERCRPGRRLRRLHSRAIISCSLGRKALSADRGIYPRKAHARVIIGFCKSGETTKENLVNPIFAGAFLGALLAVTRKCPHCGRFGVYSLKRAGQFYACKHCGRKFQEKKK
ncbi:MAG: transposase [Blastocatellia bacterium]